VRLPKRWHRGKRAGLPNTTAAPPALFGRALWAVAIAVCRLLGGAGAVFMQKLVSLLRHPAPPWTAGPLARSNWPNWRGHRGQAKRDLPSRSSDLLPEPRLARTGGGGGKNSHAPPAPSGTGEAEILQRLRPTLISPRLGPKSRRPDACARAQTKCHRGQPLTLPRVFRYLLQKAQARPPLIKPPWPAEEPHDRLRPTITDSPLSSLDFPDSSRNSQVSWPAPDAGVRRLYGQHLHQAGERARTWRRHCRGAPRRCSTPQAPTL